MPTTNPNLGTTTRLAIYVEGSKLGKDFLDVINFKVATKYYEGQKETLGASDV